MNRNKVDIADCLSKMSKADILKGFVTERLAAVSREILAAVDRLITGYEEDASGFRQEIDRQRRQLETLQQPRVTLIQYGAKCNSNLCHVEKDEDEPAVYLENLEDLNLQTPSRTQFEKRKPGRPRTSKTQKYVDLKICILEDSQTEVLSKNVLKKCPVLKLKCPRGLREAEFLDLLKAAFPQLAGDNKPFDILMSNKRRRLQCLRLKTVTPEEIQTNVSCTDLEKATLYIRLKAQKEPQSSQKENQSLQTQDVSPKDFLSTSAVLTCDDVRPQTSSLVQGVEGSRVVILCGSSTSHQHEETDEADDVDYIIAEPAENAQSTAECRGSEREQGNDNDDDWKPDKSAEELRDRDSKLQSKKTKKQKSRHYCVKVIETKTKISDDDLSCKVCGDLHKSEVAFVKHAWSHVDDLGSPCGVCGALSESAEALKDHLQNHHKTHDCDICGESFLSILSLNEHVAAHSGEKPYKCNVCHNVFALQVSLENHQKLHEAGTTHKCYTCHEVFELKEQLKAHYRIHTNKKTHLCGVCGKSLSDYRSLSRHKFTHTGERPHSCHLCGRRFKLIGTLRQHEKTHLNRERSYLCDVCCKMFLTSKQLQIHMRMHTNEKPYHCGECGKGFTTKGPLTVHRRVHTGETPYRCPDCGWSFKRKSNLDEHLTVHSGVKAFVCGICGKACARRTHLTVHMRTHNGERPYKCTVCDKAFTQSHCLKTHMKSHQKGKAPM